MNKKISQFYVIYAFVLNSRFSHVTSDNDSEKCHYRDTVDLRGHHRLENGSYLYYDTLIPKHKIIQFKYNRTLQGDMEMVAIHPRGCVCDALQGIYCIKLCCEIGEMFNYRKNHCEKIPDDSLMPSNVSIRLQNETIREVNIFKHFVFQVEIPCVQPEPLPESMGTWSLYENGHLNIQNMFFSLYNTTSFCYTPQRTQSDKSLKLLPLGCPNAEFTIFLTIVYGYGLPISTLFFTLTAAIYLAIKELRESLRGKIIISYLSSMAVGYMAEISGEYHKTQLNTTICKAEGYIGHFALVAGFMWLGILSHDIRQSFTNALLLLHSDSQQRRFRNYSFFVWGFASIQISFMIWAEYTNLMPEIYKPDIGIEKCWLNTKRWSAAFYFFLPMSLAILYYVVTFIRVSIWIYQGHHNTTHQLMATQKYLNDSASFTLRLFVILGITWIAQIASYFLRHFQVARIFSTISIFLIVINGIVTFILLTCRRNIYVLLKKQFYRMEAKNFLNRQPSFSERNTDACSLPDTAIVANCEMLRQMDERTTIL